MKKAGIIIINILIMVAILAFVVFYTTIANKDYVESQTYHFENTTIAMEHVTENYLEGEQRICDVWARYINSKEMTLTEAASFIRISHVLPNASAHLVYTDSKKGVSTRSRIGKEDDFNVSYANIDFLNDIDWISNIGESINVSRAYTNPMNGEQSIAFCNKITLFDDINNTTKDAILLRVLPISELEGKWTFPHGEFQNAEITLINLDGDYILKSKSFKNSNFFEFYRTYNSSNPIHVDKLKSDMNTSVGSIKIQNSRGETMLLSYIQISESVDWIFLSLIPYSDLSNSTENWLLVGVVSASLLLLFIIDILFIQSLNKKLRVAAKEAALASKAKTDFLSTMSHDIRTPMNAIIGLTVLSQKKLNDVETVRENLRKINIAGNHLLTLINDILDISKVESGKLVLSPVRFSIVEMVENLVTLSQTSVKEKNINFNFRVNKMEKEYLYADQLRLNQIYINILSNAIKYTDRNGTVSVDMREDESEIPGCIKLTYRVEDNGMGMSKEYMEKMFQPFTRQTDSRVNKIQGTGLGLTITKQMVDLMGGTIECESEEGKGTTFTIAIDIKIADRQIDDILLEPIEILLADDDEVFLETTEDMLESIGAKVVTASNGMDAIEIVKKHHQENNDFDLIILDWKMPDMDGIGTISRIRKEIDENIPILLSSAYDISDIEDEAKQAGVSEIITKPFFKSTIYDEINKILGNDNSPIEEEEDYSDLEGINILVAEDNDTNWEIIQDLLELFGVTAERAENGRVCVDMMKNAEEGKYMLIFMDVQMPVMNGLDATRAIRKLDNKWASSIPIVAMTADAFSENVTECLNAGMNGHLAKPIDIKLVIKEIRKIKEREKNENN